MSTVCSTSVNDPFVRPTVTGAEVLRCVELGQLDLAGKLLKYGEASLDFSRRCASLYSASIRSASSAGSSSSGSRLGVAGLTGPRLESIAKIDSWRTGGSNALGNLGKAKLAMPDGYCYLKLLNRQQAESVADRLGPWPTIGSVLRLGVGSFQSLAELERFRLVPRGERKWHVSAGGVEGHSFLDVVATCAGPKVRHGTLGQRMKSRVVESRVNSVAASHLLGGGGPGCDYRRSDVPVAALGGELGFDNPGQLATIAVAFERFSSFAGGLPNEKVRQEYMAFLRDCPEYVRLCPALADNVVMGNSQIILGNMEAEGEKVVRCDVSALDATVRAEAESVLDRIFRGYDKVPFLGGFAYVTSDREVEYFGPERMSLVFALHRMCGLAVSYVRGAALYVLS